MLNLVVNFFLVARTLRRKSEGNQILQESDILIFIAAQQKNNVFIVPKGF